MANTVITYPAQKLKIESMRGSHFKLVINVKESSGANYDFSNTTTAAGADVFDTARIRIFDGQGLAIFNNPPGDPNAAGLVTTLDFVLNFPEPTVVDGKITFEWATNGTPYAPLPGKYKYHIFTENSDTLATTIWLYGDFVVVDNNTYTLPVNITQ